MILEAHPIFQVEMPVFLPKTVDMKCKVLSSVSILSLSPRLKGPVGNYAAGYSKGTDSIVLAVALERVI